MESFGANTIIQLFQPVSLLHWLASIFLVEVGHLIVFYIYYHWPTRLIAQLSLELYLFNFIYVMILYK